MSKKHFLRGLRDGIPIGLGYFAVSFGIGISAHNAHLSIFQGFLLSFLNNASSGESGGIPIIAADSGLWAMALMMLVVNARYLLMSCALSQRLSPDTPLPWRLLIAYDLTDEIFGLAIAQPGYLEVWYYFGTMCAAMPGWSIGTVLGVLMGNLMPVWAVSGCSVMLFGMFLAIIIPVGKQNRIVLEGSIPSPANPPKGCKFHTRCANCMACCKEEAPVQREIEPGHFVCCHLYDK